MDKEKLEQLLYNEKFVKKLLSLETGEKVREELYKKGIKLRPEDMDDFAKAILYVIEQKGKIELNDNDLDTVSGGYFNSLTENQKQFEDSARIVINNINILINDSGKSFIPQNIPWIKQYSTDRPHKTSPTI